MENKKNIMVLILVLLAASNMHADAGGWGKSFTINGGSIYSESDDTDIELTKEILIFNGEYTKAVFQFKNTSDKTVTISCGFPVRYALESRYSDGQVTISKGSSRPTALDYFRTTPLALKDGLSFILPEAIPLNEYNNSREFILPEDLPKDLTFQIAQNGRPVPIEKVLLERHAGEDGAWITFHYKHQLTFDPGEVSVVVAEYYQDLFYGHNKTGDAHYWYYVIGTGSTWKGPIGELIIVKPASWRGNLKGMDLLMEDRDIVVLKTVKYEPSRDEVFFLYGYSTSEDVECYYLANRLPGLKKMWIDRSALVTQPDVSSQSFVTSISASSFLPDNISVFTNNGVIEKAGFTPAAAFDGLAETSWCENVQGDGIGQYLEFSLTKAAWGLSMRNGFTRLPVKDWLFDSRRATLPFDSEFRDDSKGFKDYFTQNNRIKKLSVADSAGNILHTLELDDQRDPQVFLGINLPPGRYRFVIENIYQGTKWQDTCLGEVTFLEAEMSPQMSSFSADPFYMESLRGVSYTNDFGY